MTRREIKRLEHEFEQDDLLRQLRAAWQQHTERIDKMPSFTDEELMAIYRRSLTMPPVTVPLPPRTAGRRPVLVGRGIASALAAVVIALVCLFGPTSPACAMTPTSGYRANMVTIERMLINNSNV